MSLERPNLSTRFHFPKKKRILIFSMIALFLLAGILIQASRPLNGKVLTVHPAEFTKSFTEEAQVHPLNEWSLYNSVDGKIEALHVQNGDPVTKGQLLLELGTQDLIHQLDGIKAQLTSLEGQRLQNNRPPYTVRLSNNRPCSSRKPKRTLRLKIKHSPEPRRFMKQALSRLFNMRRLNAKLKSRRTSLINKKAHFSFSMSNKHLHREPSSILLGKRKLSTPK